MRGLGVAGVAGLLLLAGCGASDDRPGIDELADTISAQTASHNTAHVSFDVAGGTDAVRGEGSYRITPKLAADFSLTGADGPTRFIVIDKTIYLRLADKSRAELGVTKPWVRFTPGGSDTRSKALTYAAGSMTEQADIGAQLEKMRRAGTVTGTTAETLAGQQTTRYAIDVDVAKLITIERDPGLRAGLQALRKRGVTTIPYQLWVDGQNLPAQITVTVPGEQSGTVTMRYTNWGSRVEVTAPPADQVADLPKAG
jgi:hypothetical protein